MGELCDQEEASGFCLTDVGMTEVDPCVPMAVCQNAPPVSPEFRDACNDVPERCRSYVVPSDNAPSGEDQADGETATGVSNPVGKTTSIYRWYYEKGKPQAYGICVYNEDGSLKGCEEVGKMKFGAVIELRGRRSYWKQWSWAIEGSIVKSTHLWNCTDDNTGSPFRRHELQRRMELYFYSFYYTWKASGYGSRQWRFPKSEHAHHRYSLKFECYEGWGPSDEAGECRFPHEA